VWIPGTGSPETVAFCAERRYPYIFLETDLAATQDMLDNYKETARQHGYEPGPEHIGYLQRILVADTDEKAREIGKGFLVGNVGQGRIPLPPDYMAPIGYNSRDPKFRAMKERVRKDPFQLSPTGGAGGGIDTATWDEILNRRRIIVGSPESVIRQIRETLESLRPGILGVWTNDGTISHQDTMRCLELMGQEVLPAVREIAAELDLPSPFEKEP
jgi:alkanesulfonate monooxygenase SsuD/methylene tetrahydromethanopterin reductase-like flavin-dependent oxidoreductase (luciferase family)